MRRRRATPLLLLAIWAIALLAGPARGQDVLFITTHSGPAITTWVPYAGNVTSLVLSGIHKSPEFRGLAFLPDGALLVADAYVKDTGLYSSPSGAVPLSGSLEMNPWGSLNKGQVHTYGLAIVGPYVLETNQDTTETITYHNVSGAPLGTFWTDSHGSKAKVRGICAYQDAVFVALNALNHVDLINVTTRQKVLEIAAPAPNSVRVHPDSNLLFVSSDSGSKRAGGPGGSSNSVLVFAATGAAGGNGTAWVEKGSLPDPADFGHPCGLEVSTRTNTLYVLYQAPPAVVAWNISGPCCNLQRLPNIDYYFPKSFLPEQIIIVPIGADAALARLGRRAR